MPNNVGINKDRKSTPQTYYRIRWSSLSWKEGGFQWISYEMVLNWEMLRLIIDEKIKSGNHFILDAQNPILLLLCVFTEYIF